MAKIYFRLINSRLKPQALLERPIFDRVDI